MAHVDARRGEIKKREQAKLDIPKQARCTDGVPTQRLHLVKMRAGALSMWPTWVIAIRWQPGVLRRDLQVKLGGYVPLR